MQFAHLHIFVLSVGESKEYRAGFKTFANQTIFNTKYFDISSILHIFATLFERLALVL